MEEFRLAWRRDVAPRLPTKGLEALATALAVGDVRLQPGSFVRPWVGTMPVAPPEVACPIGFALWQGLGIDRVDELFAAVDVLMAAAVDVLPDGTEQARSRHFTGWVDSTPWPEVVATLLGEVQRTLALRARGEADRSFEDETARILIAE